MSRFHLGGSKAGSDSPTSSRRSSTSSAPLPFPEPLPRSDFLVDDFDPSAYLSSLGQRHQTLEDLRGDLRARSQLLGQELLELVNSHYHEFLSLGSSLKGGEEKVEELRVGLLSFRREVEGVRAEVRSKEQRVQMLLEERRKARMEMEKALDMLEWDEHIADLESRLMFDEAEPAERRDGTLKSPGVASSDGTESNDSSSNEEDTDGREAQTTRAARKAVNRARRTATDFVAIQQVALRIGGDHPFVFEQKARLMRLRNTLLLDVRSAHRQARACAELDPQPLIKVMAIYRELDASHEAIEVLKTSI